MVFITGSIRSTVSGLIGRGAFVLKLPIPQYAKAPTPTSQGGNGDVSPITPRKPISLTFAGYARIRRLRLIHNLRTRGIS